MSEAQDGSRPAAATADPADTAPGQAGRAYATAGPAGTATGPAAGLTHRAIMVVLVPLMLVAFMATLDQTIVATAIPGIGRALNSPANAPWIATAYLLTSAVSTLILGKCGDIYGRKRVFQLSVVVFLAGSLLCATATSMTALIGFRALQGIGGGGLTPLVQAITGDLIPARQRAKYQAHIGIIATVAVIAGPLLGGVFVDDLSWRWIFLINLPVGAVALTIIAARLHLPVHRSQRRADLAGGLTVTVFTTTALLVTVWGGSRYHWASGQIIGLIVIAAASLAGYLLIEHRAADPITPLSLFRTPVFAICAVQFFLSTLVLFAGLIYVPGLMQYGYHYTSFEAGLFLVPMLGGVIGGAMVSGTLIARTGRYKIFPVMGALLAGAGLFSISLLTAASPAWIIAVLLVPAGTGIGFFVQVSVLAGQNAVGQPVLGVATGALNFFKTMGGAFGAAIFGAILAAQLLLAAGYLGAFRVVFAWTLPFMIVALVLAVLMPEKPLSQQLREVAAGNAEIPEY
jgi:EmrB/QacA subfamily drug resistance transporter